MPAREIYLDNSATTRPFDEVIASVAQAMAEEYYNPSSPYGPGLREQRRLQEAREAVAALAGMPDRSVIFTSGGTESNHLAIRGALAAMRPGRDHLVASAGEHPSVMRVMDELETRGYAVDRLPLDGRGQVSPAALDAALTPRTALVSVMHVNNETGAVMPIEELGRVIRSKAPDAVFHVDGVQALGRVDCGLPAPDLYSVSGHKIHAPKGVGALLVRPGLLLRPVLLGGGQEEGLRSGTENTPGIRGFGRAAELYRERRERYAAHLRRLKERLARGIAGGLEDVFVNGPGPGEGAPHILNVSFVGLRGEVLLRALEAEGIFVGTGSACSARKRAASPVLIAMGLPPERVDSAIRFSLSPLNTEDEIDAALDALYRTVPRLRRFGRKK